MLHTRNYQSIPSDKLKHVSSEQTVALKGLLGTGSAACDILQPELSIGRGGKFIPLKRGNLEYSPSGNEPKIMADKFAYWPPFIRYTRLKIKEHLNNTMLDS
ncbi:hypothetical protein OH492_18180 [Vibrio chagasii]|nr:hypothetical protein [Vibrio chagasii]